MGDDASKSRTEQKIENDQLRKEIPEIKTEFESKIMKLEEKFKNEKTNLNDEVSMKNAEIEAFQAKLVKSQEGIQSEKKKYALLQDDFLQLKKEKCKLELDATCFEQKLAKIPENIEELITANEEKTVLQAQLLSVE